MSQLKEAREIIASLVEGLEGEGLGVLDCVTEARWFLEETEEKVYGVQFRSMHTAIHNVIVFEERHAAITTVHLFEQTEQFPDDLEEYTDGAAVVDIFEIDYRNPPKEYKGKKLAIVNTIFPDVYGA